MHTADVTTGTGRQVADLSPRPGASAAAVERCGQLLRRAVGAATGADGAIFAFEGDGGLDPVVALRRPCGVARRAVGPGGQGVAT